VCACVDEFTDPKDPPQKMRLASKKRDAESEERHEQRTHTLADDNDNQRTIRMRKARSMV